VDGLPEDFEMVDENFLEAEAGNESVVIAQNLAEILMLPVVSKTRGVVIQGKLTDKGDDATMVVSSVKGGTPGTASSVSNSIGE